MAPRTVGFSESASPTTSNHPSHGPSGISNQPNLLPKLEDLITTSFYFIKTHVAPRQAPFRVPAEDADAPRLSDDGDSRQ